LIKRDGVIPLNSKLKKAYLEGGLDLILNRAKDRLWRTNSAWWFWRDLQTPILQFDAPFQFSVRQDRRDEILHYMKGKKYLSNDEERVAEEHGHWFLGLFKGQEVKGFCKCGFKKVYLYDVKEILSLPDGLGFIYEYEVDEQLRHKGIGKVLITSVLGMLAEAGWKAASCHIPKRNIASIKVVESCGFKKIGLVRFVEVLGHKWKSRDVEDLLAQGVKN